MDISNLVFILILVISCTQSIFLRLVDVMILVLAWFTFLGFLLSWFGKGRKQLWGKPRIHWKKTIIRGRFGGCLWWFGTFLCSLRLLGSGWRRDDGFVLNFYFICGDLDLLIGLLFFNCFLGARIIEVLVGLVTIAQEIIVTGAILLVWN